MQASSTNLFAPSTTSQSITSGAISFLYSDPSFLKFEFPYHAHRFQSFYLIGLHPHERLHHVPQLVSLEHRTSACDETFVLPSIFP